MTNHLLAYGGDAARNGDNRDLLPQGGIHKDYPLEVDIRKSNVRHSVTWHLNPDQKKCSTSYLQRGIPSQGTYFKDLERSGCPIKVGDVINAVILPKFASVQGFWWLLRNPVPGLVVNIGLQGCANSLNPNGQNRPIDAIGIPVLENLDLGTTVVDPSNPCLLPQGFECIQSTGNKPGRYLDQNDMLQIEIVALPEEEDFTCIDFCVSPVVDVYCKGDMAAMSKIDTLSYGANASTRII